MQLHILCTFNTCDTVSWYSRIFPVLLDLNFQIPGIFFKNNSFQGVLQDFPGRVGNIPQTAIALWGYLSFVLHLKYARDV